MLRAYVACELGQWGQAQTDLKKALKLGAQGYLVSFVPTRILASQQRWQEALESLSGWINSALFISLPYPELYLWRGEIYEQMGQMPQAISDYYHYLLWRPQAPRTDVVARKLRRYLAQAK